MHISTDEVFGTLGGEGFFREDTPYRPTRHIPPRRPDPTIWRALGARPMASDHRHQLLQQLCPYQFRRSLFLLLFSTRSTASRCGLREGAEHSRLALRRRSREGALLSPAPGKSANATTSAGATRSATSTSSTLICDILDEISPRAAGRIATRHVRGGSSRTMISATPSTARRSSENWDGAQPRPSSTGLRKTVRWYLENPLGGRRSDRENTR